jgi:hypothetical protein
MQRDVVIDMPTDMRGQEGHISKFDVDYVTPMPRGITALTIDIPASGRITNESRPPPRWKTPEFIFYYVVALFVLPLMAWVPIRLSSRVYDFVAQSVTDKKNPQLHTRITLIITPDYQQVGCLDAKL